MGRKGDMKMPLKDRLAEFDASRNRPPEVMAIIRRGIDRVRESGAADPDYTVRMEPAEIVGAIRKIVEKRQSHVMKG
jgi:hypothetical protein